MSQFRTMVLFHIQKTKTGSDRGRGLTQRDTNNANPWNFGILIPNVA